MGWKHATFFNADWERRMTRGGIGGGARQPFNSRLRNFPKEFECEMDIIRPAPTCLGIRHCLAKAHAMGRHQLTDNLRELDRAKNSPLFLFSQWLKGYGPIGR